MKPVIVITRPLKPEQVAKLQAIAPGYEFVLQWEQPLDATRLVDVEVILGGDGPLTTRILDTPHNRLGFVQAHSAGVDYLDVARLKQAGVLVANTSGIHAQAIAEYVLGAILHRTRAFDQAAAAQVSHQWLPRVDYAGIADWQMVIVGAGRVGTQVAATAKALGMTVIGVSRSGKTLPHFDQNLTVAAADAALAQADVVVNLLPATAATQHFFDAKRLAALHPGVMFINVGRGATVDTQALIAAITSGQVGHAVLDVFEEEPLPAASPLWTLPHTVITPHIAGQVPHFTSVVTKIYADNLAAYLKEHRLASHQL